MTENRTEQRTEQKACLPSRGLGNPMERIVGLRGALPFIEVKSVWGLYSEIRNEGFGSSPSSW